MCGAGHADVLVILQVPGNKADAVPCERLHDYGYDAVFERQVEGLGQAGDVLVGISTSGQSENVIRAVRRAAAMHMTTVGLLGKDGGMLKGLVNRAIVVDSDTTARIQEAHIFVLHYWAYQVEKALISGSGGES
jgi:D-sedoheptulose 7-phosphate isomerase